MHVKHFLFSIFFVEIFYDLYFEEVNSFDKTVSMMSYCFMLGFYLSQPSVFLFIERRKIFIEIETGFDCYNGSKTYEPLRTSQG